MSAQFFCIQFSLHLITHHFITYTFLVITFYSTQNAFNQGIGLTKKKTFSTLFLHTAHGCIVPSPPKYGRLVSQTEDSIKFLCNPSFIFPDTFLGSRTLYCTDRNTWDNSLPDCVGMFGHYR